MIKGYKATDKDMKCRGFQFEIGKWYEHEDPVVLCESGFHFCKYPSGVFAYYNEEGMRVFEVEAEDVLEAPVTPGADYKFVCRKIRFVKEIFPNGDWNTGNGNTGNGNTGDRNTGNGNVGDRNTGDWNTGYSNTGDSNTGDSNTGDGNTGDWNTGDWNTGYSNTGDWNTGYSNTGDSNTGDWNTGYWNTGNRNTGNGNTGNGNTGDWNTGDWNTGYWNTGNRNTGNGNVGNYHSGDFCIVEETVKVFDVDSGMFRKEYEEKFYSEINKINTWISEGKDKVSKEDFGAVKNLPGITFEKLEILLKLHKEKEGNKL